MHATIDSANVVFHVRARVHLDVLQPHAHRDVCVGVCKPLLWRENKKVALVELLSRVVLSRRPRGRRRPPLLGLEQVAVREENTDLASRINLGRSHHLRHKEESAEPGGTFSSCLQGQGNTVSARCTAHPCTGWVIFDSQRRRNCKVMVVTPHARTLVPTDTKSAATDEADPNLCRKSYLAQCGRNKSNHQNHLLSIVKHFFSIKSKKLPGNKSHFSRGKKAQEA